MGRNRIKRFPIGRTWKFFFNSYIKSDQYDEILFFMYVNIRIIKYNFIFQK